MTLQEVYIQGKQYLHKAGIDSPAFDSFCLFARCFGLDRQGLAIHGKEPADPEIVSRYQRDLSRRAEGYPLQYLVEEWEFMGLPFLVGQGVLIPRVDTEVVVRECAQRLKAVNNPMVMDLCAGSGTISIGLCSLLPNAKVTAVELSEEAFGYLQKNIALNHMEQVTAIRGDVLQDYSLVEDGSLDALVSNPPYIPSGDMPSLQKEVQWEPRMALDGGEDGLDFYREIAQKWLVKLRPGGIAAVEIGIHQDQEVPTLLKQSGLKEIRVIPDLSGIPRVVSGVWTGGKGAV